MSLNIYGKAYFIFIGFWFVFAFYNIFTQIDILGYNFFILASSMYFMLGILLHGYNEYV